MDSLRARLQEAEQNHEAIGHFNISDLVALKAVFAAAQEMIAPVIVGLSVDAVKQAATSRLRLFNERRHVAQSA